MFYRRLAEIPRVARAQEILKTTIVPMAKNNSGLLMFDIVGMSETYMFAGVGPSEK